MKFNQRSLVLATALVMIAGQAAAANMAGTDAILYVSDSANLSSYTQDIGPVSSFSPANSGTQMFAVGGANWNSFINQATFSADMAAGKVSWGVIGSASTSSFISTVGQGQVATVQSNSAIGNVNSIVQSATGNSASPTNFAAANSSGKDNWNLQGNQLTSNTGFTAGNAIGASGVAIAQFDAGSGGAAGTLSPFLQTASFTMGGAMLTMAAVPEPESYALMFLGLLMVGGIVRYRKS